MENWKWRELPEVARSSVQLNLPNKKIGSKVQRSKPALVRLMAWFQTCAWVGLDYTFRIYSADGRSGPGVQRSVPRCITPMESMVKDKSAKRLTLNRKPSNQLSVISDQLSENSIQHPVSSKQWLVNAEPRTMNAEPQTDLMSNLCAIPWYIKVYGY